MAEKKGPLWRVPARVATTGWVQVRAASARSARRKVLGMLSGARQPTLHLDGTFGAPFVEVADRQAVMSVEEIERPEEETDAEADIRGA